MAFEGRVRDQADFAQSFLKVILPHLHRCTQIKASFHILVAISTANPHPLPKLRDVHVAYTNLRREPNWAQAGLFQCNAPS